jgi:hypothetical protein
VVSAGSSSSLGAMRSSHAGSSSSAHSARCTCPCVTASQASPQRLRGAGYTASSIDSCLSDSSSLSVSVPGVTTRTTLRSTGPLDVAGSPICSQMATDAPSLISRDR